MPLGRFYNHIAFGPDGIIAASYDRSLHFIDSASGCVLEMIEDAHDGSISQLVWNPVHAVIGVPNETPMPFSRLHFVATLVPCKAGLDV